MRGYFLLGKWLLDECCSQDGSNLDQAINTGENWDWDIWGSRLRLHISHKNNQNDKNWKKQHLSLKFHVFKFASKLISNISRQSDIFQDFYLTFCCFGNCYVFFVCFKKNKDFASENEKNNKMFGIRGLSLDKHTSINRALNIFSVICNCSVGWASRGLDKKKS